MQYWLNQTFMSKIKILQELLGSHNQLFCILQEYKFKCIKMPWWWIWKWSWLENWGRIELPIEKNAYLVLLYGPLNGALLYTMYCRFIVLRKWLNTTMLRTCGWQFTTKFMMLPNSLKRYYSTINHQYNEMNIIDHE